jgi:hypothetical protein
MGDAMIFEVPRDARCSFAGCTAPATHIACGRGYGDREDRTAMYPPAPAAYCEGHARQVAGEHVARFLVDCPNCGCLFGVG